MKMNRDRFPREQLHMLVDQIDEPYLVEAIEQLRPFISKSQDDVKVRTGKKKK